MRFYVLGKESTKDELNRPCGLSITEGPTLTLRLRAGIDCPLSPHATRPECAFSTRQRKHQGKQSYTKKQLED